MGDRAFGIGMFGAKNPVNLYSIKALTKNRKSNKAIKPILDGLALASLRLLKNRESLIILNFAFI